MSKLKLYSCLAGLVAVVGHGTVLAGTGVFADGDVFVSSFIPPPFGNQPGTINWYDSSGVLQKTITLPTQPTGIQLEPVGMRHHPITGQLWVTTFLAGSVAIIDTSGNYVTKYPIPGLSPESIVFDSAGNAWVGGPGAAKLVELSPTGAILKTYNVAPDPDGETKGTDWIELSPDETTIYYTGEGPHIKRFDIVNGVQLPDFADLSAYSGSGFTANCYGNRALTDGSLLVVGSEGRSVFRLDANGQVVQTYPVSAFVLALSTDGLDFFHKSGGDLYRRNAASGLAAAPFNPLPNVPGIGIAVYGDTNHASACASNKTVICNPAWDFDPPVACNACCTNLDFTEVRTVVYSDDSHSYHTRTWQATDCCNKIVTWSETVTVVNGPPPVIALCPTNIFVCVGTNGCGPMPDATGQVLASVNGVSISVAQDIPPGTVLCSGTNVTFTATNDCGEATNCVVPVVLTNCCCTSLLQRPWGSALTNIAVWELTDTWTRHDFSVVPFDPKLLKLSGTLLANNNDFATDAGEYYDVFLSEPDGTPNTNGCCVTIDCALYQTALDYESGGNIGAVELDFADGTVMGASSIGNVQLGQGISDPALLASQGQATNAMGLHNLDLVPAKTTYLGYSNLTLTVCYEAPCVSALAISKSPAGDQFTFSWPTIFKFNYWQLQQTTNILDTNWMFIQAATNSPFNLSNSMAPQQYFRLMLRTN